MLFSPSEACQHGGRQPAKGFRATAVNAVGCPGRRGRVEAEALTHAGQEAGDLLLEDPCVHGLTVAGEEGRPEDAAVRRPASERPACEDERQLGARAEEEPVEEGTEGVILGQAVARTDARSVGSELLSRSRRKTRPLAR